MPGTRGGFEGTLENTQAKKRGQFRSWRRQLSHCQGPQQGVRVTDLDVFTGVTEEHTLNGFLTRLFNQSGRMPFLRGWLHPEVTRLLPMNRRLYARDRDVLPRLHEAEIAFTFATTSPRQIVPEGVARLPVKLLWPCPTPTSLAYSVLLYSPCYRSIGYHDHDQ